MKQKTASVTIDDIRRAASVIAGHVVRTPAIPAPRLAEATGAKEVVLKLENLQYTGSFKDRGAYNKLASLDAKAKAAGVIAMSAGNHAQGVAYHDQRLGIPSTIVMPEGTPFRKLAPNNGGQTIAEGIAVKSPGRLTQAIITELVSDLLLVSEDALERAVQMMSERQKIVAEGAGAAGLAALIAHGVKFKDKRVG